MDDPVEEVGSERFELRRELGRGAVGVVWRAFDRELGQEVALKLLLRQGDGVQTQRFLREGEFAGRIRHPGVCSLVAAGRWRGQPFLAYELIASAKTLHDVFPLARVRRRIELVRDTAEALGAAHAQGVVHRDVKPANVLVDEAGQVKVTDFGAAAGESLESLTATGTLVGTPAYMAPEQMGGEREAIGPATDVWALGVMLYECLTETSPFVAETLVGFMRLVRSADFPPVQKVVPDTHPAVVAICHRALSLAPEDRYADAGELAAALEGYLSGGAAAPRESGRAPLVAAALLLPALGVGLWQLTRGGVPAPSPSVAASVTRSPAPSAAEPSPESAPDPRPALLARAKAGDAAAALALGRLSVEAGAPADEAEPWLRQAAEAGLAEAWEILGELAMDRGAGREGLQCWQRALEAGSRTAFALIGRAYESGRAGVPRDRKEAAGYFRRGADAGDHEAQERLGYAYYHGRGVTQDYAQARAWLARAAQGGQPLAMRLLGVCDEFGEGRERPDLAAALRWYRAAAEAGDGPALTNIGYLHETGKGVPVDYSLAVHFYRQAAELGVPRGWFRLGVCARRGTGLPKSSERAREYFQRGAEAGSSHAALSLGDLVGKSDPVAARKWYLRATELGHSSGWFKLGLMHEQGRGGPKDLARAAACYAKGHEAGEVSATTALGVCYEWGYGVDKDEERAFRLFTQSAQGGHARGMAWLGVLYRKGKGTTQDHDKALAWFRRGAKAGDSKARSLLRDELKRREEAAASPTPGEPR